MHRFISPTSRTTTILVQANFGGKKETRKGSRATDKQRPQQEVDYGQNWYAQTRAASRPTRTTAEEIAYRREANRIANNGLDRKDLYTDNWDGDKYKGSPINILNILAVVSILVPILGLVFAYQTYGVLWG